MEESAMRTFLPVRAYDLAATLTSGQAFRWELRAGWWEGVVGGRWIRLRQSEGGIAAEAARPQENWSWLQAYLQTGIDLDSVLSSFPDDEPIRASVAACRGLRLLRQDPWECLASFILSSTKQILQIQQIIRLLCAQFGDPAQTPSGRPVCHQFPSAGRLAAASEAELRACKMGFRAPNLLATSRLVAGGDIDLACLHRAPFEDARDQLTRLPGVGAKIADCVLLFAYGFPRAFPVDVWVMKALRELYFPKRRPSPARLRQFVATHFGVNAGYAQQYLFHYVRTGGLARLRKNPERGGL
jgi:N-glycosylase/DNA lyase